MVGSGRTTGVAGPSRRWPIALCLAAMLVYPLFAAHFEALTVPLGARIGEIPARFVTEGAIWLFAAVVVCIAMFGEPRTFASIGLKRPTWLTPLWGVAAAIVLMPLVGLSSALIYKLLHEPNHAPAAYEAIVRGSLVYALFLALRAGVVEEVLYRGLAIEQLSILTGRRWLAGAIAAAVFVLGHAVHVDAVQLIPGRAGAAIGLTTLYLWRRNLWINIIAHVLIDSVSLVVVALRLKNLYRRRDRTAPIQHTTRHGRVSPGHP